MKIKKIRGAKRRVRSIENWKVRHLTIDEKYFAEYSRDYVKFFVDPWASLLFSNSKFPQPNKIYKKLFIKSLIEIYHSWKNQLEILNRPFYLKIWLFENDLKNSQVVCAVCDKIDFYKETFKEFENKKMCLKQSKHFHLLNAYEEFKWESKIEVNILEKNYLESIDDFKSNQEFQFMKKWWKNLLDKNLLDEFVSGEDEYFVFENDSVWIGELK